jgi:hypothetical protein
MYWDRDDDPPSPSPGLKILNQHWQESSDIPPKACGFLLGPPPWRGAYFFAEPLLESKPFRLGDMEYSSDWATDHGAESDDVLFARGPVGACKAGSFEFKTSLAAFGIHHDKPVQDRAGSFIAEFTSVKDIEWLDSTGNPFDWKPTQPKPIKIAKPKAIICVKPVPAITPGGNVVGNPLGFVDCRWETDGGVIPNDPSVTPLPSTHAQSAPRRRVAPSRRLIARTGGILAGISDPRSRRRVPQIRQRAIDPEVEVTCPVLLTFGAVLGKAPGSPEGPQVVKYRFVLPPWGKSTIFTAVLSDNKPHLFEHTAAFPFQEAIKPSKGGATDQAASDDFVSPSLPPDDGAEEGDVPIHDNDPDLAVEPDFHHTVWARVEALTAEEVTTSGWARIDLVCR